MLLLAIGKQNELKYFWQLVHLQTELLPWFFFVHKNTRWSFQCLLVMKTCCDQSTWTPSPFWSHVLVSEISFWLVELVKARPEIWAWISDCWRPRCCHFTLSFFNVCDCDSVSYHQKATAFPSEPSSIITPLFPGSSRADRAGLFFQPKQLLMEMWGASLHLEWLFKWFCVGRIGSRGGSSSSNTKAK